MQAEINKLADVMMLNDLQVPADCEFVQENSNNAQAVDENQAPNQQVALSRVVNQPNVIMNQEEVEEEGLANENQPCREIDFFTQHQPSATHDNSHPVVSNDLNMRVDSPFKRKAEASSVAGLSGFKNMNLLSNEK